MDLQAAYLKMVHFSKALATYKHDVAKYNLLGKQAHADIQKAHPQLVQALATVERYEPNSYSAQLRQIVNKRAGKGLLQLNIVNRGEELEWIRGVVAHYCIIGGARKGLLQCIRSTILFIVTRSVLDDYRTGKITREAMEHEFARRIEGCIPWYEALTVSVAKYVCANFTVDGYKQTKAMLAIIRREAPSVGFMTAGWLSVHAARIFHMVNKWAIVKVLPDIPGMNAVVQYFKGAPVAWVMRICMSIKRIRWIMQHKSGRLKSLWTHLPGLLLEIWELVYVPLSTAKPYVSPGFLGTVYRIVLHIVIEFFSDDEVLQRYFPSLQGTYARIQAQLSALRQWVWAHKVPLAGGVAVLSVVAFFAGFHTAILKGFTTLLSSSEVAPTMSLFGRALALPLGQVRPEFWHAGFFIIHILLRKMLQISTDRQLPDNIREIYATASRLDLNTNFIRIIPPAPRLFGAPPTYRASAQMRRLLKGYRLDPIDNNGEGDCFLYAVLDTLEAEGTHVNLNVQQLRVKLVHAMEQTHVAFGGARITLEALYNMDHVQLRNWSAYLQDMRKAGTWCDTYVMLATTQWLNRPIALINDTLINVWLIKAYGIPDVRPLVLGHENQQHFVGTQQSTNTTPTPAPTPAPAPPPAPAPRGRKRKQRKNKVPSPPVATRTRGAKAARGSQEGRPVSSRTRTRMGARFVTPYRNGCLRRRYGLPQASPEENDWTKKFGQLQISIVKQTR